MKKRRVRERPWLAGKWWTYTKLFVFRACDFYHCNESVDSWEPMPRHPWGEKRVGIERWGDDIPKITWEAFLNWRKIQYQRSKLVQHLLDRITKKVLLHQDKENITNIFTPNNLATKYMEQYLRNISLRKHGELWGYVKKKIHRSQISPLERKSEWTLDLLETLNDGSQRSHIQPSCQTDVLANVSSDV